MKIRIGGFNPARAATGLIRFKSSSSTKPSTSKTRFHSPHTANSIRTLNPGHLRPTNKLSKLNSGRAVARSTELQPNFAEEASGSVKRILSHWGSVERLYFSFGDQLSVFDLGPEVATIPGVGNSRTIFAEAIFQIIGKPESWLNLKPTDFTNNPQELKQLSTLFQSQTFRDLCESGMPHHSNGLFDAKSPMTRQANNFETLISNPYLLMGFQAANAVEPTYEAGEYIYPTAEELQSRPISTYQDPKHSTWPGNAFVIPLEWLSRTVLTPASSITGDAAKNTELATSWGIEGTLEAGRKFVKPFVHASTKRETIAGDTAQTRDDALRKSGLTEAQFKIAEELIALKTLLLKKVFKELGLDFQDVKFELVCDPSEKKEFGGLKFADTTSPDEMRLRAITSNEQLAKLPISKQLLRVILSKAGIDKIVKAAKDEAISRNAENSNGQKITFKDVLDEQGFQIPQVREDALELVGQLYEDMAETLYYYAQNGEPNQNINLGDLLEQIQTQIIEKDASELFTPESWATYQAYLQEHPITA